MYKTYSDLTADDLMQWCVRHKFMSDDSPIAEAVRKGAPEALRISRRQFYDYANGTFLIPGPIAALMEFYDWYPKRVRRIKVAA